MLELDLRDKVLRDERRIMDFGVKNTRKTRGGQTFTNYFNGPIIEYDGQNLGDVFHLLNQVKTHEPTRTQMRDHLIKEGVPTTEGVYVIDNGTRSSVICTSNIAHSLAKVILDGYYATHQSDGFSKRIAHSSKVTITLRSITNSYYTAAKIAGLLDNVRPDQCLSDTKGFYRKYPGYKRGLLEAGNINTLLIEDCLDQHIRPSFLKERELRFWRDKDYKCHQVMDSSVFVKRKLAFLEQLQASAREE